MVSSGPEIVCGYFQRSNSRTSKWSNFPSANSVNLLKGTKSVESIGDLKNEEMDIRMIMKDMKKLGSSNMTWKERKKLEDQNVVSLGGKVPKNQKRNLGVSKVFMKSKKKKEQKKLEQESFLGRFVKQPSEKEKHISRRPEDRVLRSTEGYFKKGVLDVKHLLKPIAAKGRNNMRDSEPVMGRGRKKGKGKGKGKGRKQKGGQKRH